MANNWQAYEEMASCEDIRASDRFQAAGTYANLMETPDTTDEEWARAFFDAYNTDKTYLV